MINKSPTLLVKPRRRSKSPSLTAKTPARIPVRTTFRHMPASATIARRIDAEVRKLQRYCDRITRCHVVILAPHRHHRFGRSYSIHVEIVVPRQRIVVGHDPANSRPPAEDRLAKANQPDAAGRDILVLIRTVFDSARRQLEDYERRRRGDVKKHEPGLPGIDRA